MIDKNHTLSWSCHIIKARQGYFSVKCITNKMLYCLSYKKKKSPTFYFHQGSYVKAVNLLICLIVNKIPQKCMNEFSRNLQGVTAFFNSAHLFDTICLLLQLEWCISLPGGQQARDVSQCLSCGLHVWWGVLQQHQYPGQRLHSKASRERPQVCLDDIFHQFEMINCLKCVIDWSWLEDY